MKTRLPSIEFLLRPDGRSVCETRVSPTRSWKCKDSDWDGERSLIRILKSTEKESYKRNIGRLVQDKEENTGKQGKESKSYVGDNESMISVLTRKTVQEHYRSRILTTVDIDLHRKTLLQRIRY